MAQAATTTTNLTPTPAVAANADPNGTAATPAPVERLWPAMGWWKHLLICVLLAGIVIPTFSNSYRSGMTLDNRYIIEEYYRSLLRMNPKHDLASWNQIGLIFANDYWWPKGISGLYRPITTFTYWLDYVVFTGKAPKHDDYGKPLIDAQRQPIPAAKWKALSWPEYANAPGQLDTFSYHTINLVAHWLNAVLVYFVALCILKRFWPAAMVAALFAVHPITTETVTNIIGRADIFAALAIFGGLLLYISAVRYSGSRALPWLVALLLLTTFGLFSKESAAAIFLVFIAYDVTYRWRFDNPRLRGLPPLIGHGVLYLLLGGALLALPGLASWIAAKHHLFGGLPMIPRAAIATVAIIAGAGTYIGCMKSNRLARVGSLIAAVVATTAASLLLPWYPLIVSAAVVGIELTRGTLTSDNPRFKVVAHATLYLPLYFLLLAIPLGAIWFFDRPGWANIFPLDTETINPLLRSLALRYTLATLAFGGGLAAHFLTIRLHPVFRAIGLLGAICCAIAASFFTLWMGVLLMIIVALHEVILGSFVSRRDDYRRDWSLIWNGFALGYLAMLPPLIAMGLTRAWVFANSTPAEEPFLDNPIRGIWRVAELKLPSFTAELAKHPMFGMSFPECKMTAVKVMGKLFMLLAWPRTLCSDYSFSQIPNFSVTFRNGFEDWKAIIALVACILFFVVLPILTYRRNKALCFFSLFFFAAALPTSNFFVTIGSIMAERFMYLPLAGFTAVLVIAAYAGVEKLWDWLKLNSPDDYPWHTLIAALILPVVVMIYAIRAYDRNWVWESDLTLWRDAIKTSPLSFRSHQSLAFAVYEKYLAKANDKNVDRKSQDQLIDEMIAIDEGALPIVNPLPLHLNSSRLYLHLGLFYELKAQSLFKPGPGGQLNPTPEAQPWLEKTRDILEQGSAIDRAFNEVNYARQIERGDKPEDIGDAGLGPLYGALGTAYMQLGDYRDALNRLQYYRHLDADDSAGEPYAKLAQLYFARRDIPQATVTVLEGMLVAPERQDFWQTLSQLYSVQGPAAQTAFINDGKTVTLNFKGNALVHEQLYQAYRELIRVLLRSHRTTQAVMVRDRATRDNGYPPEIFEALFKQPLEKVTPDGIQYILPTSGQ